MLRIGMCVLAGILFWFITSGWQRPFTFREGDIPDRAIAARVPFTTPNPIETDKARAAAREQVVTIYRHDRARTKQLQAQLKNGVLRLLQEDSFEAVQKDKTTAALWAGFMSGITAAEPPGPSPPKPSPPDLKVEEKPPVPETSETKPTDDSKKALAGTPTDKPADKPAEKPTEKPAKTRTATPAETKKETPAVAAIPPGAKTQADYFAEFKAGFAEDKDLAKYTQRVAAAMAPMHETGMFKGPQHTFDKDGGNQSQIRVVTDDRNEAPRLVTVDEVRIDNRLEELKKSLEGQMSETLARHTYAWFSVKDRLKETLTFDRQETEIAAAQAASEVEPIETEYGVGQILADGSVPLSTQAILLLEKEHEEMAKLTSFTSKAALSFSHFGMYAAIFSLCGFYSIFRKREVLTNKQSLLRVLCLAGVTLLLCQFGATKFPEAVLIPLLLFSMTIVIAYDQEVALLLSTVTALIVVVSLGFGMKEFAIFVAAMATSVLCLRHVRGRTKLIYVSMVTAAVSAATALGAATLHDPMNGYNILLSAAWYGFFSVVAGLLMTGLLPFIESLFDIQTELSLLELSDVSHPLLQELVRRAPGTYHHTMNVASIAEAAAESIGANGLLVRVGAYCHDTVQMLMPGYSIENHGDGGNRHESLLPAMSTLVIIAHVKDGADLARQHNLPNSLVDFIMQHHGTTLVEYFYNRASEESKADPDSGDVDEHSYRYPGPKPQTKEAAVLMLSDTVESACRSLTDPTPSRIENLVHDLGMKKLLDGQFDECDLTLSELNRIEVSLIKSLAAVYHARIKYPDQQQSA